MNLFMDIMFPHGGICLGEFHDLHNLEPGTNIVDGNSEIGAHVGSNIWYLICLRRLISLAEFHDLNNLEPGTYILDGNTEIGAHVGSNLCHLICLRHLIKSSYKSDFFFL